MTRYVLYCLTIWSDPRIAGELAIARGGAMHFTYAADWLAEPMATPLSHALPKQAESFGDALCKAVIGGLLPEGGQRTAIAGALGVSPENPFRRLAAKVGRTSGRDRECQYVYIQVGAVTVKKKLHTNNISSRTT